MYADGTQLCYAFKDSDVAIAIQQINSDLATIFGGATDHSFSLNAKKTVW